MTASEDEARLLIHTIRAAMNNGHRYFHPTTHAPLLTVEAVINCLVEETAVLIRTPEPPVDIDFRPLGGFRAASQIVRTEVTSRPH